MATKLIFNAATQQEEEATLVVDRNNEIVATFADGNFLKFPAGLTPEEFANQIALVKVHNEGQEIITPEMEAAAKEARAASYRAIGVDPETEVTNTGNPMPESQSNDEKLTTLPETPAPSTV